MLAASQNRMFGRKEQTDIDSESSDTFNDLK